MPVRVRKLIGAIALLGLLAAWTILAATLAVVVTRLESPLVSAAYYVIAGLGWVLPAMPLISWMSRPAS
jgi:hypothetical protein